jgi:hypothetical protein
MTRAVTIIAATLAIALSCHFADARTARDRHARAIFADEHPCPTSATTASAWMSSTI